MKILRQKKFFFNHRISLPVVKYAKSALKMHKISDRQFLCNLNNDDFNKRKNDLLTPMNLYPGPSNRSRVYPQFLNKP